MKKENLIKQLRTILTYDDKDLLIDEPLKKWTTWKVGGPAELLVFPRNIEQVVGIVKVAKANNVSLVVLGNGSNVLVKDKGIKGIVINTARLEKIEVVRTDIYAEAGISLSHVANVAQKNSLTGLEFSVGIPASIGGAILMNAGAWGKSIGDLVKEVTVVDYNGKVINLSKEELNFKYRQSNLKNKNFIIVRGKFGLSKGDPFKIQNLMALHRKSRLEKQPIRLPNAGSVFKNPEGYAAGYLIESVGLKGFSIGGAMISNKHANFIVNSGNATAEDILKLIDQVVRTVQNFYGIHLELEVNVLG